MDGFGCDFGDFGPCVTNSDNHWWQITTKLLSKTHIFCLSENPLLAPGNVSPVEGIMKQLKIAPLVSILLYWPIIICWRTNRVIGQARNWRVNRNRSLLSRLQRAPSVNALKLWLLCKSWRAEVHKLQILNYPWIMICGRPLKHTDSSLENSAQRCRK